jgi:hypothetical protein
MGDKKKDSFNPDKPLCKLVKREAHIDHLDEYVELVKSPKFVCEKCGRAAQHRENLCEPRKIKDT